MGNVSRLRIRRHDDQGNPRSITEEIQRLHIAGIVITAAFVKGDEDGRVLPQIRITLHRIDDFFCEAFKEIQLGRGRMAVYQAAWLDIRDRGKRAHS